MNIPGILFRLFFQVAMVCVLSQSVLAEDINQQLSKLQADVDSVEQDISELEKNLLFPPLTRVEVYLAFKTDQDYFLRSVTLSIDGEEKSFHIYSDTDLAALRLGGLQHFWEGNVALGEHELMAQFIGEDRKGNKITDIAIEKFEKELTGKSFELQIVNGPEDEGPQFRIKDWGKQ